MSGALDRGGANVVRPSSKPSLKNIYSHDEYLDMIDMVYNRFLDRAGAIEKKQKAHLFTEAASETFETIKQSGCYSELHVLVRRHRLTEPLLKGAALKLAATEILGGATE